MTYLPAFQPQSPDLSGCALGWASCTCFAAGMVGDYDTLGVKKPKGCSIRARTGDTLGGTNLAQVDLALQSGWGINLDVRYRLDWATFAKRINQGSAAVLQGWYGPIADSRFDAGGGFRGNHAIAVMPGWIGMDPLADGRRPGIYKYHGEVYPQSLLRTFAGKLNIGSTGSYRALGDGLVYAAFSRDNTRTYRLHFEGGAFYRYFLNAAKTEITHRAPVTVPAGTPPAPVSAPRLYPWPGNTSRLLVHLEGGDYQGIYVAVPQSQLRLEEVP